MQQAQPHSSQMRSSRSLSRSSITVVIAVASMAPAAGFWLVALAAQGRGGATAAKPLPVAPAATSQDKFITTSEGRKVHYVDWGNAGKRPFIMLHGINRTGHSFDKVAPFLHGDYHVIAMTLRGHGVHGDAQARYAAEDHARDLHSLIEQLKSEDVVLNGNSMGGRVVQVYAGQHPERVWKMIVDDVGPSGRSRSPTLTSRIGQETDGWASEEELLKSLRGNRTRTPEQEAELLERAHTRARSSRTADGLKRSDITAAWADRAVARRRSSRRPCSTSSAPTATSCPRRRRCSSSDAAEHRGPDDSRCRHTPHQDNPQVWLAVVRAFFRLRRQPPPLTAFSTL
jgi:pimeloyl-ACP methyl ester carboxylesterase